MTGFCGGLAYPGTTFGTVTMYAASCTGSGVAVVGMVIVRPRTEHQVGLELTDHPDHLLARFQRGHQLAVVVVEDVVLEAEDRGYSLTL